MSVTHVSTDLWKQNLNKLELRQTLYNLPLKQVVEPRY